MKQLHLNIYILSKVMANESENENRKAYGIKSGFS